MKSGAIHSIEHIIPGFAVIVLCVSFIIGHPLALHPLWLIVVTSICIYSFFKLVLGGQADEFRFQWVFPLAIGTIWQIYALQAVDIFPLLYVTVLFAFFSLRFQEAVTVSVILVCLTGSSAWGGFISINQFVWLAIFCIALALLTRVQSREKESILARYDGTLKRIDEFRSQAEKNLLSDEIPDLDTETRFVKSAANEFKLSELLAELTEIINTMVSFYSCIFFCLDERDNTLKIQAYKTRSRFFEPNTVIDPTVPGILSHVYKNGKKLKYDRVPKERQTPEYYAGGERIQSCIVHPILINDKVEGLLVVDSKVNISFGENEDKILAMFSNLAASLIMTYRIFLRKDLYAGYMGGFYQAVRDMIQTKLDLKTRLEKLIQISNMFKQSDEVAVVVPHEGGTGSIEHAEGETLTRMIGAEIESDSLSGKLMQSQNDVLIPTYEEMRNDRIPVFYAGEPRIDLNSMMFVALPMQNNLKGMLFLGSTRKNYYTQIDKDAFAMLAAQLGVALENVINLLKIQKLAETDGLTGLNNHRRFQERMSELIAISRREPMRFCLLLLDIDHFKRFNDTFGHQAGDQVLIHLAKVMKQHAREIDIVARYGGEEFAIVLRQCEPKMAVKIAERIRKASDQQKIKIRDQILNITVSIGISCFPEHGADAATLIAVADEALYRAKERGRNRVELEPVEIH